MSASGGCGKRVDELVNVGWMRLWTPPGRPLAGRAGGKVAALPSKSGGRFRLHPQVHSPYYSLLFSLFY